MGNAKLKLSSEGKRKLMKHFKYTGDPKRFAEFLAADPAKQHLVNRYYDKAKRKYKMYSGGMINEYKDGGLTDAQIANLSTAEAEQLVGQLGGANIKGSTGDYSDLDTFKSYSGWQGVPGGFETWKKVAEKAGLGKKDKKASDMNVKSGAHAGSYKHTAQASQPPATTTPKPQPKPNPIETDMMNMAKNPTLTASQTVTPQKIQYDSATQDIAEGTGQLDDKDPQGTVTTANKADDVVAPTAKKGATYTASKSKDAVDKVDVDAETLDKDKIKTIDAEQQTKSSVSDLKAEQGEGIMMDDPEKRKIEEGEMVEGSTVDPEEAAKFTEELKAAEAEPSAKATVLGQLEIFDKQFEKDTPAWAKLMLKKTRDRMAAEGIQGSDMSAAMMQAMLEQQINLASMDAQTYARFEGQNLSNRQQRVMLAAEQRARFMGQKFDQEFQSRVINASKISDIANMNFNAKQQVALENSRIANTMNLANLSNKQALVMAEAAALSQLDITNLNNRQQAAVQNAQNFLAVDMANLSNKQQASMLKAQGSINAILSDTAAENAQKQFNASSANQMNQFYDGLSAQVSQFNTAQANAMSQFNAGQKNAMSQFNTSIQNQRDQFNAQNQMVIAQSNVQWRRAIATGDTAAINRANELNAQALINMSQMAYQNIWQQYGDAMERAWRSSESELDRMTTLATTKMQVEGNAKMAKDQRNANAIGAIGGFLMDFLF